MPDEDTSLTDFLPDDGGEPSAGDDAEAPAADETPGDDPPATADTSPEETDDASVEPAAATAIWTPDGGACADCGAAVERRWRDGDALVCGDCKDWSRRDGG